jgi:hypothetical protein
VYSFCLCVYRLVFLGQDFWVIFFSLADLREAACEIVCYATNLARSSTVTLLHTSLTTSAVLIHTCPIANMREVCQIKSLNFLLCSCA